MHSPKALILLALIAALSIAPAGCSADLPHPKPTPHRHFAPVFKTDAEALAAAKRAYTRYLAAEDAFLHAGGVGLSRFDSVVAKSWIRIEIRSAHELQAEGRRQTGFSRFFGMRLHTVHERSRSVEVATYACLDLSDLAFVSTHNKLDVAVGTVLKAPVELNFISTAGNPKRLLLERQEPWAGKRICQ